MPLDTTIYLVSVDDVMHELNAPDTDFFVVEGLVNAASARIEEFCDRIFKQRTVTKTFEGYGDTTLDMGGPIISVSSVTIDGVALVEGATADFQVLHARGEIYRPGGWPYGIQNIVVTAVVGYSTIPHTVRRACIDLVKHWYRGGTPGLGGGGGAGDIISERISDYSYTRAGPSAALLRKEADADLPDAIEDRLLRYKRWVQT